MDKLTVAHDFQALCPTLTDEELRLLEESLVEEGCQHAIVVWKCGKQTIIVDGHNRYAICKKHRIAFKVHPLKVESRQEALGWAARNQLGRRNATEEQKAYLRGKLYQQSKRPVGAPPTVTQLAQNELITTAAVIAEETGVSAATVKRDETFATAVDELAEKSQELKDAALRGAIPKSSVAALADAPKSALKKLEKLEGKELRDAVRRVTAKVPDYGKCPNCAGTKWDEDEDGVSCHKCHHPWGESTGGADEDRITTQRQKTVKTVEALMRAFDDLQIMKAKKEHGAALEMCHKLLKLAKEWK